MKKFIAIGLPFILIAVVATLALTQEERRIERPRRNERDALSLAGRGYRLGVILDQVAPKDRQESGVLVKEVLSDSPAEKAGLKDGDVIVKVDGESVSDPGDIRRMLRNMKDSKQMDVEILRDGKQMSIAVMPEERPMSSLMRQIGRNYLGIGLQDLNPDLATYFKADPNNGVLITRVDKESPAEKAGIRSGDVITSVNGKKIVNAEEFADAVRELEEGEEAKLTLLRHGKQQTIAVKPERRTMPGLGDFRELRDFREHLPELRDLPEVPDLPDISKRQLERELGRMQRELRRLKDEDIARLRKELSEDMRKEIEQLRQEIEKLKKSD